MFRKTSFKTERVCRMMGCEVADYTAGPVYADTGHRGRHHWWVEFNVMPESVDRFARELDRALCDVNSDYAAKRSGGIFLDPLTVSVAPHGLFNRWLSRNGGRLGGQRKIPRLSPTPQIIDELSVMAASDSCSEPPSIHTC